MGLASWSLASPLFQRVYACVLFPCCFSNMQSKMHGALEDFEEENKMRGFDWSLNNATTIHFHQNS